MQRQQFLVKKPSVLDQAIRYINDHYRESITIESVANAMHCSTRYLNRLFTEKLGESPVRILTHIRMDKAAQMLIHTDMTLLEIAESMSYSDVRVLSRIFKKHFDMTPAQYRTNNRQHRIVPKWSPIRADHVIGSSLSHCYTENGYQNQSMYRRKGEFNMFTRSKPSIAAIMFVCFAVLLGGCANTTGNQATASPEPSPAETVQATEPTVRSFTDQFGTRDIPVHPERVYSIGATSALLALGIQPVGAPKFEVAPDYYLSNYATPVNIVGDYPPNYEAILELKPDLIVASGYIDQEVYEQLAKVAPTATFEWMGTDIYDQFTQVAEIVGKQDEAAEWIKQHQERALEAKNQLTQEVNADETLSILWIMEDTFHVVGNRNLGHVLYKLLGIKPAAPIQQLIDDNNGDLVYTDPLSLEVLPEYDADRIIVMVSDVNAGAEDNYKAMQQSSLWKNLKAVKNNQVYEVPYDKWWSYTIFSADGLLEDAVKLFEK
jgi:iron complex transport system substrate-binding protein